MKKFIKELFSSSDGISSKRIFGAIGYISAIVFIGIWMHDMTEILLITSASLLGLETITNIFRPK